ncbi:peptidase [Oceanidesulfovibrio indonesiensis]|uniref:Peptidase n=2 Tax=Oceanidesulfovibrio indonesiensis TaxID=54767 RepID=A0A7M3MEF9_9BACT|nr:peptidase [Oceanidesulfovibrio indonesiensis]
MPRARRKPSEQSKSNSVLARARTLAFFCTAVVLAGAWLAAPVRAQTADIRRTPVVRAVEKASPAVVNITTDREVTREMPFGPGSDMLAPFFREFFGDLPKRSYNHQSMGSGVIIDGQRGLVLSNAHVISGATSVRARLADGREFQAQLVGSDPDFDLAVLRLEDASNLPQVPLGDSDDILIGETVIAIGNPFGFTHTVTTGVISAVKRSIRTDHGVYTDFIQTDAAINPGNSGGPLLNLHGELIGINTAIHAQAEGIGFAIPVNKAKRVVGELLGRGRVSPVWLGLAGQNIDPGTASYFGLKTLEGMIITNVYAGLPGAAAGLKPGDVLLTVQGVQVQDKEHYLAMLQNFVRGEKLTLEVLRDGNRFRTTASPTAYTTEEALAMARDRWGMVLSGNDNRRGLALENVLPQSPAGNLGLRRGDVLLQVGGMEIQSRDDFAKAFMRHRMNNQVLLIVGRGGRMYHVRMQI